MNYYISDLHFGHRAIIDLDERPFNDVTEMEWALIDNWNEVVTENDTVYILGDFSYENKFSNNISHSYRWNYRCRSCRCYFIKQRFYETGRLRWYKG